MRRSVAHSFRQTDVPLGLHSIFDILYTQLHQPQDLNNRKGRGRLATMGEPVSLNLFSWMQLNILPPLSAGVTLFVTSYMLYCGDQLSISAL